MIRNDHLFFFFKSTVLYHFLYIFSISCYYKENLSAFGTTICFLAKAPKIKLVRGTK